MNQKFTTTIIKSETLFNSSQNSETRRDERPDGNQHTSTKKGDVRREARADRGGERREARSERREATGEARGDRGGERHADERGGERQ